MRKFTLKWLFVTAILMVLGCMTIHAADGDLITRQFTIKLDEAGTLPDKIGSTRKYLITNLKIIGEINGTDLRLIRDMAGSDTSGNSTDGKLMTLDLLEAKIVKGGNSYFYDKYNNYYPISIDSNDVICNYAFYGCSSLSSIILPSDVTSISNDAFLHCSNLSSITIPSSVTSIGNYAFCNCSCLTNIILPPDVTSIGNYAFSGCSSLSSINLPSGVTSIGNGVFFSCSSLSSITIPSSVTSIGSDAFSGCSSLSSINLPSGITSIGYNAFSGCSSLTSINLPSGIDNPIGKGVFSGCSSLSSITIPSGVTSIGDYAFYNCSSLPSINLPSSVTSIGNYAFYNCSGLKSIYVSSDTPAGLGSSVFDGVDKKTCTLYIPEGTYDDYWLTNWGEFENIIEYDPTGIVNAMTSNDVKEISRYSVNGQRLDAPIKGLNIVKYSDGSVRKIIVQ